MRADDQTTAHRRRREGVEQLTLAHRERDGRTAVLVSSIDSPGETRGEGLGVGLVVDQVAADDEVEAFVLVQPVQVPRRVRASVQHVHPVPALDRRRAYRTVDGI